MLDSGGLNKLPLDRSAAGGSSADFCKPGPKLNCAGLLLIPSPLSPNVNVGLDEESLASSP